MGQFKGVVAATITPFTPEGKFNEKAFIKIMESNIKAGVDGFWVSGGTGESVLLTEEEVNRTSEISVGLCKGKAKSIIHVGTLTTAASVRMARVAARAGADAIACVPPFFYGPSEQAIIEHYKAVADAAGDLPFFVYNQPRYTQVEFTAPMLDRIKKAVPQIVGVKHSAPDFNNTRRFKAIGLDVFTGSGSLFLSCLAAGGVGVVDGPLTVSPELWINAYRAYQKGNMAEAQKWQDKANVLIDLAAKYGMQATCKALCDVKYGVECREPRRPILPLSREQKKELVSAAEKAGVLGVAVGV